MKRHRVALVAFITGITLLAGGCSKNTGAGNDNVEFHWPESMVIVSSTGVGEAVNIPWAQLLEQDTGMAVRVVPEGNLTLRLRWLKEGRFFMTGESTSVIGDALSANKEYAFKDLGPFPIRIIYSGGKTDSGFIVRGDSLISRIEDIKKGIRMPEMTFSGSPRARFIALATWAGIGEGEITWVPFSTYDAMVRGLTEGKVDVAFAFPTSPVVHEAESSPRGIRWLELPYDTDPEGAQRFLEVQPYANFGVMSQGVKSAHGVKSNSGISLKYVTASASPELVYHMVKWFHENFDRYNDAHPVLEDMTFENLVQGVNTSFVPAHEGLMKYLREQGLWKPANDARQKANLALLETYMESYRKAMARASELGMDIDPLNPEWLTLWESYRAQLPGFKLFPGLD